MSGMAGARHRCPACRRESAWDPANPYRPFCSERCRLIDLGAWLKEEHVIPGEPAAEPAEGDEPGAPRRPH